MMKPLNVSAWNLAFVAVAACHDSTSMAGDADGGSSGAATSDGIPDVDEPLGDTDGSSSSGSEDSTDASAGPDNRDRCDSHEDCGPGRLCEVYDDGYTAYPYADCLDYGIYEVDPCPESAPLHSTPLPSLGRDVVSLSFVDVDGDGRDDIIAGYDGGASVLYGPGAGSFEPLPIPERRVISTASADFDGDGRGDIAALSDDGTLTLLLGQADGGWSTTPGPEGSGADRVFGLDLDGDEDEDLALFDAEAGTLEIWTSEDGAFVLADTDVDVEEPVTVDHSSETANEAMFYKSGLSMKEHHGDGRVFHQSFRGGGFEGVAQLHGGPDPAVFSTAYADWTLLHVGQYNEEHQFVRFPAERPQAADLDGDGRDELVLDGHTGVAVLPARPSGGGFACYLPVPVSVAGLWAIGDLDGDGRAAFVSADGDALLYQSLPPDGALEPG